MNWGKRLVARWMLPVSFLAVALQNFVCLSWPIAVPFDPLTSPVSRR
jgi:hypothetical protein